jgi:hypothetical protein
LAWSDTLAELREYVHQSGKSIRAVASEIGMSHANLKNLLDETTGEPYESTKLKVERWIARQKRSSDIGKKSASLSESERRFLEFLINNFEETATFMTTSTEGLSGQDRRMVALAIITGLKKMAIALGEPVPRELFDLEAEFLSD